MKEAAGLTGPFNFEPRGRGWGRGTYSGNNNNNSNNDFQKRNREEEWDPEYTPKSKKYYLVCVWDKQEGGQRASGAHRGLIPRPFTRSVQSRDEMRVQVYCTGGVYLWDSTVLARGTFSWQVVAGPCLRRVWIPGHKKGCSGILSL